jgi:selenium metabolism protein YedF
MKVVDTRGLTCPAPLIKTRKGLTEASPDETVQIIIDNSTSLSNVKRYLADNKINFTVKDESDIATLTVIRGKETEIIANKLEYCDTGNDSPHLEKNTVVMITADRMGSGDDELGTKLIISFFRTLVMIEPAPSSIVFYNAGVKLAIDDSPVLEHIKELQEKGTAIFLCSTCINHFNLRDRIVAGSFSDMYQIISILNDADHIIRP